MAKKKPAKIKSVWDKSSWPWYVMLQVNDTTLQGLWFNKSHGGRGVGIGSSSYYTSDTFSNQYDSMAEAKEHTMQLAREGYWGEVIREAVTGETNEDS